MLTESGILLKNHVVIYSKILHYSFIPTIYENFKSVQTKLCELTCLFDLNNRKKIKQFCGTFTG